MLTPALDVALYLNRDRQKPAVCHGKELTDLSLFCPSFELSPLMGSETVWLLSSRPVLGA
jgi:hypothetical protein